MLTIAILEPDDIIALDIARTIEHAELASTEIFRSTEAALQCVRPATHSLILVDIGDDQQKEIEAAINMRRTLNMRCLIFSDHTISQSLPKLRDAEPLGFLVKPFSSQELLAIVESALYRATMEEKLQASERRYRNLFQYSLSARCVADSRGAILERNRVFERNFPSERLSNVQGLFSKQFDWNEVIESAKRAEILQRELQTKDFGDGPRDVICSASLLLQSTESTSIALEIVDITELKHTREELFQSQKQEEIGRITSGVAHDLNNFLTSMMGFLELMKLDLPEESITKEDIGGIEKAIQKTSGLTKQILGFSRKKSFEPRAIDLCEVLSDSMKMMKRLIPENIAFTLELPDEPITVYADIGHVEQILLNLVVNARDALVHVDSPRIEIRLKKGKGRAGLRNDDQASIDSTYARIEIIDNGCGIESTIQKRIFEPYFTTKEAGKGTGLGLVIVKSLVEMNGGWIGLESEEGKGSSFVVVLPMLHSESERERESARAVAGQRTIDEKIIGLLQGRRILVVDDDASVLESCGRVLLRGGAEITACVSVQEAYLATEKGKFDLLLSDIVLPGTGGADLWAKLKRESRADACLFMTGYESNPAAEKFPEIEVLYKPFDPSLLVRKCAEAMKII